MAEDEEREESDEEAETKKASTRGDPTVTLY